MTPTEARAKDELEAELDALKADFATIHKELIKTQSNAAKNVELIASLRAELDRAREGKREIASAVIRWCTDGEMREDEVAEQVDEFLDSKWSSPAPTSPEAVCVWTEDENHSSFSTACGEEHCDEDNDVSHVMFCQHCGRPIQLAEDKQ